jgi:hypothetical protein
MASRKKAKTKKNSNHGGAPNANAYGAVDARSAKLEQGRAVRGREAGDGDGVDIGISPGAFSVSLEKHLKKLSPATKERMLSHLKEHVELAMKPLVKLVEREGDEHDVHLLKDVGPNMLRTVIECLEDKSS